MTERKNVISKKENPQMTKKNICYRYRWIIQKLKIIWFYKVISIFRLWFQKLNVRYKFSHLIGLLLHLYFRNKQKKNSSFWCIFTVNLHFEGYKPLQTIFQFCFDLRDKIHLQLLGSHNVQQSSTNVWYYNRTCKFLFSFVRFQFGALCFRLISGAFICKTTLIYF